MAHQGAVYGVCEDSSTFCQLHVKVARDMFVRAHVQRLAYWCGSSPWSARIGEIMSRVYFVALVNMDCSIHSFTELFFDSVTNLFAMLHWNNPLVKVDIKMIKHKGVIVKYVLEHSGYLILPYIQYMKYFQNELKAPYGCAIMVSFQQSFQYFRTGCSSKLDLIYREPNSSHQRVSRMCVNHAATASIFVTSSLQVQMNRYYGRIMFGYKLYFSTLPEDKRPEKLPSGLFNCSINHYSIFQHHIHCNIKPECEDGRDESEHCPFSSPGCQGLVASRNKCLQLIVLRTDTPFLLAYECHMEGGNLTSIKNRQEQENSLHIFKKGGTFSACLGYVSGWGSVPFAYSKSERWSDDTIIYNMNHFKEERPYHPSRNVKSRVLQSMIFENEEDVRHVYCKTVLCEIQLQTLTVLPSQTLIIFAPNHGSLFIRRNMRQVLTVCPNNHVTHTFLSCDPESHCGKAIYSQFCTFLNISNKQTTKPNPLDKKLYNTHAMFRCDDDVTTVPYTLVCDFRQDCPDTSDESFCERLSCLEFICSNGQCLLQNQRCNKYSDCVDDSDEMDCSDYVPTKHIQAPWVLISLDGTGYFTHQLMEAEESCPDTHYRCTAEWLYCLPVYTRCNGFSDCVYGEDEQDCEMLTLLCPGFYGCRASTVCVHGDHLCDGWGQCPQWEDELMCDRTCPQGCLCEGHSFVCHSRFSAKLFPQLRYLDATGSKMLLSDFSRNTYIIHLSLSQCSLVNVSYVKLPNLQFIDLANNHLEALDGAMFSEMPNLLNLFLTNNPFIRMTFKIMKHVHYALRILDLSRARLKTLGSELSLYLPQVQHLNLSFSAIHIIMSTGFKNMPQLTELDIRGNAIFSFPIDLFSRSKRLSKIFSSNYRHCCENLFPKQHSKINCFVPSIVFSSCTTLMPTEMHRIFIWCVSTSALLGNFLCFITTIAQKKIFENHFMRTITQLEAAYVCMGIHSGVAAIANEVFGEDYIQIEKMWTSGLTCKASGFLSFLSNEMTTFFIWIFTLDHTTILCFPGDSYKLKQRSTAAACTITWLVGILLSLIPFLPGLSHWGLHGQSGLCRLALYHHYNSHQQFRWFTVIATINCIVCSMVVAGQVVIYKRLPTYRIVLDPAKRWVFSSVHLMGKLTVINAMSWILFGVVMLMAKVGVTIAETIHEAMVVFVLPLSSAVNPLLYMWTLASLSRGQAQEDRLLEWLKSRSVMSNKANLK